MQVIDAAPSGSKPTAMALVVSGFALATAGPMARAAEGGFKDLKGSQITATVRGNHVTDDHHWGHHYLSDGRVLLQESGRDRAGKWSVQNDRLCLLKPQISKTEPICYSVTALAGQLRYVDERRRVVYQGFVRGRADARLFDGTGQR